MIVDENEEYSVIVPDYLLESETEETAESSDDYSETLSDIVINQQTTISCLEEIASNQEEIISSQAEIYNAMHFVSNLGLWVVIVSGALFFAKYFKSILV